MGRGSHRFVFAISSPRTCSVRGAGPLFLPVMYLLLDSWICDFSKNRSSPVGCLSRVASCQGRSGLAPRAWRVHPLSVLYAAHVVGRVVIVPFPQTPSYFSTSDCDGLMECYSSRHHVMLVYTCLLAVLLVLAFVVPHRKPLSKVWSVCTPRCPLTTCLLAAVCAHMWDAASGIPGDIPTALHRLRHVHVLVWSDLRVCVCLVLVGCDRRRSSSWASLSCFPRP